MCIYIYIYKCIYIYIYGVYGSFGHKWYICYQYIYIWCIYIYTYINININIYIYMVTCSNWACCFSAFFEGVASPPLPFKPNVCHCGCGLRGLCCFFLHPPAKETIQRRWSSFLHAKQRKFSLRWPATNDFGRISSHHVRHPPCPHDVAALGCEGTAAHHQVASASVASSLGGAF